MLVYPVTIRLDDSGRLVVECPDLPDVIGQGRSEAEALFNARKAVEAALAARVENREPIPPPSRPNRGQLRVVLPSLIAAKIALYEAMRDKSLRKSDLARAMGVHPPQVDRLLDLRHASRMDRLDAAFAALGKALSFRVTNAA